MFSFKVERRKKDKAPNRYRHIKVEDKVDVGRQVRTVKVECPLEYPGMTERERRRMYEGMAMIADAFRAADARCHAQSVN